MNSLTRSSLALLFVALPAFANEPVALKSHTKDVNAVAVSADGTLIASGSDDGSTILWEKGAVSATHAGDQGRVKVVAFSPNGKMLAIGTDTGMLQVWDLATKKDVFSVKAVEGKISQVKFFADGKTLAAVSIDQKARIFDAAKGKEKARLEAHKYAIYGLEISTDGKDIYTCDSNGAVISWAAKTSKQAKTYSPSTGECHALALSPDGKSLAVGYGDGAVVFVEPKTGNELRRAKLPDSVNSLAFTADGVVVAGTQNEELQMIDAASAITARKGHGRPITAVAAAGGTVVSGSMDMTVRSWPK